MKLFIRKQSSIDCNRTETEHARQWNSAAHLDKWPELIPPNGEICDERAAGELREAVQETIGLYFPAGRL